MKSRLLKGWTFLRVAFLVIIILWLAALWIIGAEPVKETKPHDFEKRFDLKPGPGRELALINRQPGCSTVIVAEIHRLASVGRSS